MSSKLLVRHRAAHSYVQLSRFFARQPFLPARVPERYAPLNLRFALYSTQNDVKKKHTMGQELTEPVKKVAHLLANSTGLKKRPTRDECATIAFRTLVLISVPNRTDF
jgi:hypothetical protein